MQEIPGKNISIESLILMFENIENNTEWNIKGDLLWGYFFTHNEPQRLEESAKLLEKLGYRVVDIYLSDKENPEEPDMYWLHVEKEETHTPHSLDKRNDELYIFASEQGLDGYDGMDVGPIDKE